MKKLYTPLFFFILLLFNFNIQAQTYVNVNATGSNDGTSWANAYTNVYEAVANASEGDQLWIAEGSYLAGLNRDDWMYPAVNVEMYGGFDGSEANLDDRDYQNNITTITGDLDGNDIDNNFAMNRAENSKHIMWLDTFITNATIIDGLTFAHGHTDDGSAAGDDRRGGGVLCYGSPIVRNCRFTQNYGYFASSLYPRQQYASDTKIDNCVFDHNEAENGGGMYIVNATQVEIRNSTFNNNEVEARGGAIYQSSSSVLYEDCVFEINSARTTGGSMHITGNEVDVNMTLLDGCSFSNNSCFGGWGGALTVYGDSAGGTNVVSFDDCTFDINNCARSGGAMSVGFNAIVNIDDCRFTGNSSTESGGAIFGQNESTEINITGSTFEFNTAVSSGGAMNAGSGQNITIDDTFFDQNTAATGGALNTSEDTMDLAILTVNNSIFQGNLAENQGGAINLGNTSALLRNCLIANNVANGTGTGGAISNNVSDTDIDTVMIVNSTLVQNNGALSSGIAQWTDPATTASAVMIMVNTINQNADLDYAIEDGSPTIISMGGNLAHDGSMEAAMTITNDENNTIADFTFDFRLENNSPGVNSGVDHPLVTSLDLDGNGRDATVDKGAYENQAFVGVDDLSTSLSEVKVYPNPVKELAQLEITSSLIGTHELISINDEGKIIFTSSFEKNAAQIDLKLEVNAWSPGTYRIFLKSEGKLVGAQSVVVIK